MQHGGTSEEKEMEPVRKKELEKILGLDDLKMEEICAWGSWPTS